MTNPTDILQSLWRLEERNHKEALNAVATVPDLLPCMQVVAASLAVLSELIHARADPTEDEKGRIWLAVRVFHAIAAGLRLSLLGYYQQALLVQRDIFEHTQLLDLFNRCDDQYHIWQTCPPDQRWPRFTPKKIRDRLNRIDPCGLPWRRETYGLFSTYSAHPDPDAWRVVAIRGMLQPEPFFNAQKLRECLFELSLWAVAVTSHLLEFMPPAPSADADRSQFLALASEWRRTYQDSLRRRKLDGEFDRLISRGGGSAESHVRR